MQSELVKSRVTVDNAALIASVACKEKARFYGSNVYQRVYCEGIAYK